MTKYRINRLFNTSGNCLDVAINHGFFNKHGFLSSIEDIKSVIQTIVEAQPDALLQMWAAYFDEFTNRDMQMPFGCITPQETHVYHQILTAALKAGKKVEASN